MFGIKRVRGTEVAQLGRVLFRHRTGSAWHDCCCFEMVVGDNDARIFVGIASNYPTY